MTSFCLYFGTWSINDRHFTFFSYACIKYGTAENLQQCAILLQVDRLIGVFRAQQKGYYGLVCVQLCMYSRSNRAQQITNLLPMIRYANGQCVALSNLDQCDTGKVMPKIIPVFRIFQITRKFMDNLPTDFKYLPKNEMQSIKRSTNKNDNKGATYSIDSDSVNLPDGHETVHQSLRAQTEHQHNQS